jgi:hypothetical protein
VRVGEWPKATTPCAPPEQGNALVAWELAPMKKQTKENRYHKLNGCKMIKITSKKKN